MQTLPTKILGTGIYLPKRVVTAEEIDRCAGLSPGWTQAHSGVLRRHFVTDETASFMGARAAEQALRNAGLTVHDIDCIVCASGTAEQVIPCTAALIQEQIGKSAEGTPCFDMNCTCLSFVAALDNLSLAIALGRYQRVLIVSSEIASLGLNWNHAESCSIMGDGAAAVVIGRAETTDTSSIIGGRMETYASGAHLAEIRGGGSRLHARNHTNDNRADYLFHMEGHAVFRIASKILPGFVDRFLRGINMELDDFDLVIPHQASLAALKLTRRRLNISEQKFFTFAEHIGNTIAASIPMGLHLAIEGKRLQRGDKVLLMGTSAGFSVGALALQY